MTILSSVRPKALLNAGPPSPNVAQPPLPVTHAHELSTGTSSELKKGKAVKWQWAAPGLLLFGILLVGIPRGAQAIPSLQSGPNFVVQTADDSDTSSGCSVTACTLRQAIVAANADPDTSVITFALPPGPQTISLLTALPQLTTSLSINGPTTQAVAVARSSVAGTPDFRIFDVKGASTVVSLGNLTIANGRLVAPGGSAIGAGIQNFGQSLTLTNCTVRDNFAGGNQGSNAGGGIINGSNAPSAPASALVLINSTLFGNTVDCTSGMYYGASGGAILNSNGSLNMLNCTVAGNSATASNGSVAYGGGIASNSGSVTLKNTIVASNTSPNTPNIAYYTNNGGNIIDGDPKLGTLADNGGPTPTIALLPGSPAINAGVASGAPASDQRGVVRDSKPDSGAYEFVNQVPTVVSVSPQNASDKVGAKRTFTISTSDGNGPTDITEISLLINTTLDQNSGADLVYQPQTGLLSLRRGDNTLAPIQTGASAGPNDILDNGAVRVVGSDVTVNTTGNAITLTIPATIRDGLVGNDTLFARVVDNGGATDATAQAGDMGFVRFGPYTVTSQFSGGANTAPTLSKLTPSATNTVLGGSGIAPAAQTFGFFVQDAQGTGDIQEVWFLAGPVRDWSHSATFVYYPRTRRLVLRSDDGNSFLGGGQIGNAGTIENSQVRVDLSKVKLTIYSDGKTLGLTLPLQAKSGLLGANKIWLRVQDNSGATSPGSDNLGFVQSGTWNVKAGTAPGDTKPSNGHS